MMVYGPKDAPDFSTEISATTLAGNSAVTDPSRVATQVAVPNVAVSAVMEQAARARVYDRGGRCAADTRDTPRAGGV